MTTYKATNYDQDGNELLADIPIQLQETGEGFPLWHGSFEADFAYVDLAEKQYAIKLDDGRTGEIWTKALWILPTGRVQIPFQGSGPLSPSSLD